MISVTYTDTYSSLNSSFGDKFTNNLPLKDAVRFRPLDYLSLQLLANLKSFLGFGYDNFIIYNLTSLLLFYLTLYIIGLIIQKFYGGLRKSFVAIGIISIFPNVLLNLCWLSALNDILMTFLAVLSLYYILLYNQEFLKIRYLVFSYSLFIFVLLEKDTAIVVFPVLVLVYLNIYGFKKLINRYKIFLPYLTIFIIYIIFRVYIIQSVSVASIKEYEVDNKIINSVFVYFKSVISILIPVDYLNLLFQLERIDIAILLYLIILIFYTVLLFRFLNKLKLLRIFLLFLVFMLISVFPYIYVGYIRPQLIYLNFIFLIILIFTSKHESFNLKNKTKFVLLIASVIISIYWIIWSYSNIRDYLTSYNQSIQDVEKLLELTSDKPGKIYTLCTPSRMKQSYIEDDILGLYNFRKYKGHVIRDTIIPVANIAALDYESLLSEINLVRNRDSSFDIYLKGESQYFDFRSDVFSGKPPIFNTNLYTVNFVEYNRLNKPIRINIKFFKKLNLYMFRKEGYKKLM
jgi:hypothetical protein